MLIFETAGKIKPEQDKTNIEHFFNVPEGIKQLKITYSYAPKTVENEKDAVEVIKKYFLDYNEKLTGDFTDFLPVKNLVTLSIDEGRNYRGAAHRQDGFQEHIISEDFASPGFFKGKITEGEWDIVLNVHCVKCDVDYNLKVEGEVE